MKVVWRPGDGPADGDGLARPWLLYRPPSAWELYIAGLDAGTWRITRLVSAGPRPEHFVVDGPTLDPGAGPHDAAGVSSPCAAVNAQGGTVVVYAGDDGERTHLCSALYRDGWHGGTLLLAAGQPGDADAAGCDHPTLVHIGRRQMLWYTARDGTGDVRSSRIAVASATGRRPLERHGVVIGRGAEGQPDELGARTPAALLANDGSIDLLYTGLSSDGTPRILRARSQDGRTFDRLGPVTGPHVRDACLVRGPARSRWLACVTPEGAVAISRWDR